MGTSGRERKRRLCSRIRTASAERSVFLPVRWRGCEERALLRTGRWSKQTSKRERFQVAIVTNIREGEEAKAVFEDKNRVVAQCGILLLAIAYFCISRGLNRTS